MSKLLLSENPHYHDVLPVIDPAWLTDTATALAIQAHETRGWGILPILADALQDAGCDCEDVLNHLRHGIHQEGDHAKWEGGCWLGECWVVNHLLQRAQRVIAAFRYPGTFEGDTLESPVLNPGDRTGDRDTYRACVWLVESTSLFIHERVIVETPYMSTAQDMFIESEFGKEFRLEEPDLSDYREPQTDSKGEPQPDEWTCNWTADLNYAYDDDEVRVIDMNDDQDDGTFVRYHGPGIRHGGGTPKDYSAGTWECMLCARPIGYICKKAEQICNSEECWNRKRVVDAEVANPFMRCVVCTKEYRLKEGYSDLVCSAKCRNSL